jgi:hypothetical protein
MNSDVAGVLLLHRQLEFLGQCLSKSVHKQEAPSSRDESSGGCAMPRDGDEVAEDYATFGKASTSYAEFEFFGF